MLGTTGTIAAEIFVLTGYIAGMSGPAAVLALLIAGLMSYSLALNYCELATTYPTTGGALTYVRESWGPHLLAFLVGSLDCLSSTFYSALSAVGFAYSLRVFIPSLPIIPVAIVAIAVFTVLNLLGVSQVGNLQIILGGVLLLLLLSNIIFGLILPQGFHWDVFMTGGRFFIHDGALNNLVRMLGTIALIYNAYIGFEVIADDAEEIKNPERNIPLAILISLTVITLIYTLIALVTLGVLPWSEIAGSETALTDAASHFLPRYGAPLMAIAGVIATLTSVNTAMLSATREAFTLSRDGLWPRFMSRLGRFRTPYVAILIIGAIVALVAAIGLVDFLSYISSSGYLFVLFWSSLAMIRLRKLHATLKRPFKTPFFPLTAYAAAAMCFLVVAFVDWHALLFGAALLVSLIAFYYVYRPMARAVAKSIKAADMAKDRILVPVANPRTAESLVHLAAILARASEDTNICLFTVVPYAQRVPSAAFERLLPQLARKQNALLSRAAQMAQARNAPCYTKLAAAQTVARGVLDEVANHGHDKLILMGWPGPLSAQDLPYHLVNVVLREAHTNVAVLLDRGLQSVRRILVPIGGGPHSRLALRLAYEIAEQEGAQVTALYCFCRSGEIEEMEDSLNSLHDIIEEELGNVPPRIAMRVAQAPSVIRGVLSETDRQHYDLLVMGASEEWAMKMTLFGTIDDQLAVQVKCSVLLVRQYEPTPIAWIRRQTKRIEKD